MPDHKQNADMISKIFTDGRYGDTDFIDRTIKWIDENMPVEEVFSPKRLTEHLLNVGAFELMNADDLKKFLRDRTPAEAFRESDLDDWAEERGYVKA